MTEDELEKYLDDWVDEGFEIAAAGFRKNTIDYEELESEMLDGGV